MTAPTAEANILPHPEPAEPAKCPLYSDQCVLDQGLQTLPYEEDRVRDIALSLFGAFLLGGGVAACIAFLSRRKISNDA